MNLTARLTLTVFGFGAIASNAAGVGGISLHSSVPYPERSVDRDRPTSLIFPFPLRPWRSCAIVSASRTGIK
jgi:hypothetical protein